MRDLKVRSLLKRSLLYSPGRCTRSLQELCWQDLCKKSPSKISEQDLYKRSLGKISVQAPYKRSLGKISVRDVSFCASMRSQNAHGHATRTILAELYKENAAPTWSLVRACAPEMRMDMSQEMQKFTGKMPDAPAEDTVSCEPAQSKCTYVEIYREYAER